MGKYDILMFSSSGLYIVCYIPELWANYKNKNANLWNVPEKIVMLLATILSFCYAVLNEDTALMTNYTPLLVLDIIALLMRAYYAHKNRVRQTVVLPETVTTDSEESIEITVDPPKAVA